MSAVFTSARLKSCAPVNTSNVGETAVTAFAAHAPTRATRISRRRPQRSASAIATSDTRTPARAMAKATPSAWSERPKALVTASPFCERRAPQKLARRATAASAPRRAACSGVNGTGGTTGSGFTGGGCGSPRTAAWIRATVCGSARRAPSHAWIRRNHVKKGTMTSLTASSRSCVDVPVRVSTVASRRAVVSGMPLIAPMKVPSTSARSRSSTSARWS